MPLFRCSKCGCVENTAVSNYWTRNMYRKGLSKPNNPALCSECDPKIGIWHGKFTKKSATGLFVGDDGFLYAKEEIKKITAKIIGIVHKNGITYINELKGI